MTCAGANRKNPITNPMRTKPACMSLPERNAIHATVVDIARKPPRECVSNTVTIVSPIAMRQALRTNTFFSSRLRKNNRGMFITSASAKSLLSSSIPPGPRMITVPPLVNPTSPFLTE